MDRETGVKMALDDVPFSVIMLVCGIVFTHDRWIATAWGGVVLGVLMTMFGSLWLAARIYHLTHKDEVFGPENQKEANCEN